METYCRMKWGPLGVPSRRVEPGDALPATMKDLQTAVSGEILWVRPEKIRNAVAQGLTIQQHPYVRYYEDGSASLEAYYAQHQPKDSIGLVFAQGPRDEVGQVRGNLDDDYRVRLAPWFPEAIFPGASQWEGPLDGDKMFVEVRQLEKVKVSVEKHGMWIALKDPEPSYYLLVNDESLDEEDYRVIIDGGSHRVAFLAHSGWPLLPVSPAKHLEVSLSGLDQWPGVLDGSFTRDEARNFFMAFFPDPHENLLPNWR